MNKYKREIFRIIGILGIAELSTFAFIEDIIIKAFKGHSNACIIFIALYLLIAIVQVVVWLNPDSGEL